MNHATIVGSGRFAKVICRLLSPEFKITILTRNAGETSKDEFFKKFEITEDDREALSANSIIFYSVPIQALERVVQKHRPYLNSTHTIIDILSVKVHPKRLYTKLLKGSGVQVVLTHPMFGPDSSKNGFQGLPIVMDKFTASPHTYQFWKKYFAKKGLRIVEMSAEMHDKLAANSQGVTHFVGRLMSKFHLKKTQIDTIGAQKLQEIMEQTCHDTWELFLGLQNFNPYTKTMRLKLGEAFDVLYNQLLPQHISDQYLVFGIQGGKGSFNEQAVMDYLSRHQIKNYQIKYLYTTEKVLSELHKGNIDYGQFAMHNSVGGIVGESIKAIARYKFKIVEEFAIIIGHAMMIRQDSSEEKIDTIITHPQVIAQCGKNLATRFPKLKLTSGKGVLVDSALAAKHLAEKKFPKNYAVMGPEILSKIYNLKIMARNLQDSKKNLTSFLMVKR
jgi:arogenate dehydrogenase (NADP+), plant